MYGYGYGNGYNYNLPSTTLELNSAEGLWVIIGFLVAICGGIVLYFTFLNPKNAENYTGTTKKIYEFLSFKKLTLEAILKICYLIVALFITITSFSLISTSIIAFILFLVIGNVMARLIFEGSLLILMMYSKLNEINDKLDKPKLNVFTKKSKNNEKDES